METVPFIDQPEALKAFCERLKGVDWFALDTEFIREKTYYPQLCLIQVATPEEVACIDPLNLEDLSPLTHLLFDPNITKVLHAASQDLEIFFHQQGRVPGPIFDTQVAASLLGHGDQVGYGKLIQLVLGVELEKGQSRTDWAQRPLETIQLRYAADDVHYLARAYPLMRQALEDNGRLAWLEDDFQRMQDPRTYQPDPETIWRRLKGINTLRGEQALAVARNLARWREQEAMRLDRPRRWLLQDEVILDLARRKPRDLKTLERVRGLAEQTARRHGDTLLELIREGAQCPSADCPTLPPRTRLEADQEALVDVAMGLLRHLALKNDISPAAIATRRDLEALVSGDPDCSLLQGWRARLAGRELSTWLRGETGLSVRGHQLTLTHGENPER
ncbi:ribonuclease D [Ectothiorhodospira haloalkaliphila]|uniref:Ribonuclease D n=2 Tax=Ectothiorhodospira haloalkaliphila TaxID=421628 RepID=W8L2I9_9GAMM|nr:MULTISPECIES: ribonuclease D [Ectothiorhodospira]AHK78130.1 ribonuclease D [Ectothiorhodospira haloalkaliphila]MCG5494625.1 ribonuclease D [Ectothiorhodospira variabilis]MCG5503616.1 ribonuclease D [Ectothiorhodospira variabilis]MCG5506669.1 ribonuclease D [Ectothiorhodospira variabilis]